MYTRILMWWYIKGLKVSFLVHVFCSALVQCETLFNGITAISIVAAVAELGVNWAAIVDSHAHLHSLVVLLVVVIAATVLVSRRVKWAQVVGAPFIICAIVPVNKPPGCRISDVRGESYQVYMCVSCTCSFPCRAHQNPLSATEQFPQSVIIAMFTLQSSLGSMTECGVPPSTGTILGQQ